MALRKEFFFLLAIFAAYPNGNEVNDTLIKTTKNDTTKVIVYNKLKPDTQNDLLRGKSDTVFYWDDNPDPNSSTKKFNGRAWNGIYIHGGDTVIYEIHSLPEIKNLGTWKKSKVRIKDNDVYFNFFFNGQICKDAEYSFKKDTDTLLIVRNNIGECVKVDAGDVIGGKLVGLKPGSYNFIVINGDVKTSWEYTSVKFTKE